LIRIASGCSTEAGSASKATNSPFYGWPLRGKAVATIVGGKKVWVEQRESRGGLTAGWRF
jgi:dihydroorotase-like cyclic amidohydrolase